MAGHSFLCQLIKFRKYTSNTIHYRCFVISIHRMSIKYGNLSMYQFSSNIIFNILFKLYKNTWNTTNA